MSNANPTPPSKASSKPSSAKSSSSSSLSSHFAMIELRQRILSSISKLADRDTHQIALSDLQSTIESMSPEAVPMLLNCLYDACSDPNKTPVKKDSLSLLALLATSRPELTYSHLPKIISTVVRRLKDSDSAVRESCRDAIGSFVAQYLRGDAANSMISLFVKPLFEALNDQNKAVQSGAAMCLAKMVESSRDPPIAAFQKLCPRICKYLNNQNFLAKAALLSVVSKLSQVGGIAPHNLSSLLQSIHECLDSTDWATRKAAADTLISLASHSTHLVADGAASTITVLEACCFDKVKPVRDSMTEALQRWKTIVERGEDGNADIKAAPHGGKKSEPAESPRLDRQKTMPSDRKSDSSAKNGSSGSPPITDSQSKPKDRSISDTTVGILKKKVPALTDKELNPDFFLKLEATGSGDLPVEVVVPRRTLHSSHSQGEEESELNGANLGSINQNGDAFSESNVKNHNPDKRSGMYDKLSEIDEFARDRLTEQRVFRGKDLKTRGIDVDERNDINQRDAAGARVGFARADGQPEGAFLNNKGNWLAIQRQLAQLERQQANLMNMLQDFMGGSHDSMITLENRVRGLERIVEDMAQDLALSSGRRGNNFMMGFEGGPGRPLSKYSSLSDFSSKLGRVGEGARIPFGERFLSSDGIVSGMRGRESPWRPDISEAYDSYPYVSSRNGPTSSRRGLGGASNDGRLAKTDNDGDQVGTRRAWDKGPGPVRLGEGPSARSVWQASKDEKTLEAIRVAGEDNGTSRTGARAIPELVAESVEDDNMKERGPLWSSWSHAMDSLHAGDVYSAYAELLSTGDDVLLVKLMDRSGPVLDQISNELACEVLHAVGQFLLDQSLLDITLSWIQQLSELVMENGADFLGIPLELKRELLMSLHEASTLEPPEDWEGVSAEQLMLHLASAWRIDLQQFGK
ncbi:TORTIFOLIA1-like protein 1 [Aristolochia californica]|uniref:TORTIFOLIA1-like protein 1 n=1 Tax=Aristolochia californica TaxID=171875 RepID=UPI0035DC77F9